MSSSRHKLQQILWLAEAGGSLPAGTISKMPETLCLSHTLSVSGRKMQPRRYYGYYYDQSSHTLWLEYAVSQNTHTKYYTGKVNVFHAMILKFIAHISPLKAKVWVRVYLCVYLRVCSDVCSLARCKHKLYLMALNYPVVLTSQPVSNTLQLLWWKTNLSENRSNWLYK